jgi:hypothetical protein
MCARAPNSRTNHGTNRSAAIRRMANLLQISSAFGRAMETVDRVAITTALYPVLRAHTGSADNVIAASAEGYAFPTNLDQDQPLDGLGLWGQAELVRQALAEQWQVARFEQARPGQLAAHGGQNRSRTLGQTVFVLVELRGIEPLIRELAGRPLKSVGSPQ